MEDSHIQRSPFPSTSYASRDVYSLLQFYITRYYSRIALIDASDKATFTYKQLEDEVESVAFGLSQHGVKQGDTVLCFAQNSLEYVFMVLATCRLGAVVCTVNHLLTVNDAEKLFAIAEPKYIFTDEGCLKTCQEIIKAIPSVKVVFIRETNASYVSYASLKTMTGNQHRASDPQNIRSEDVACIIFSSGTTGLPKAVLLSHGNLIFMLTTLLEPNISPVREHVIHFMPMAHIAGLFLAIFVIMSGCTSIMMKKFDLNQMLELVTTYKVKSFLMLPPVAVMLTNHPALSKYDLSHVREMLCAAAPLGEDTIALLEQKVGRPIHFRQEIANKNSKLRNRFLNYLFNDTKPLYIAFGLTESTGICTTSPGFESARKLHPSSVGFPISGVDLKVVDVKTGKSLGPDQQGEIMCRGPNVMKGYLKNPKATAEAIDADGWLHTGDVGYYKPDSSFYIVDRLKELIKYKAYQVAPAELEDLLLSHPLVADCAVIGVPDVEAGELPLALVVRKEAKLTEKDVVEFVSGKVAPFKRLRGGVRFVDEILKSPSGKILRSRIKASITKPNSKL